MGGARVLSAAAHLDRTLAALADPHRRQVVDLLSRGPCSAGELASAVELSAPAMSRHLRALRQSQMVEEASAAHDARVRIYRLRPEPMADLKAWLEVTERMWAEQLLNLKAHLEKPAGEA
jgi:DNA-binding transcriptional ArsR family regulator